MHQCGLHHRATPAAAQKVKVDGAMRNSFVSASFPSPPATLVHPLQHSAWLMLLLNHLQHRPHVLLRPKRIEFQAYMTGFYSFAKSVANEQCHPPPIKGSKRSAE
jgi:hypothetical protein